MWFLAAAGFVLLGGSVSLAAIPHGYYDALRFDQSTTSRGRSGNVDLVTDGSGNDLALCHLANFLCFSRPQIGCDPSRAKEIYTELATILMAIKHFNSGDGSIVPALEGINEKCPLRFTAEFEDSGCSAVQTVKSLTRIVADRDPETNSGDVLPCSVVGPRYSSVTKPASVVAGVYDLVVMSFSATSPDLSNQFQYPLFSRVVPSDAARNKAAVRFLNAYCGAKNVAMIFINDSYGQGNQKVFQEEALAAGMSVQSFPLEYYANDEQIRDVITKVKNNGARYIFTVILGEETIVKILEEAVRQGIAGPGYMWALGQAERFNGMSIPKDSPLAVAFDGLAVVPEFGGQPDTQAYQRYVEAFHSLGPEDVEYFNSVMPHILGKPGTECYEAGPGHFRDDGEAFMGNIVPFSYDTIVALGLGGCNALAMKDDGTGFTGDELSESIVQSTSFEGLTGLIKLDPDSESRDPLTFTYVVHNAVIKPDSNDAEKVVVDMSESVLLKPNEKGTDWDLIKKQQFIFPGGAVIPPDDLPPLEVEQNYIGNLRILAYVLFGIVALLSVGFAVWTWKNRELRIVRASQPFFLVLVCAGTLVLGSGIIPLSVDDQYFSQKGCDIACMSTPWLVSVGFVTAFSALFSKTWRINRVMRSATSFRKIKVTEKDVMKPFAVLMTANAVVLILWTTLAPLKFVRMPDAYFDQHGRALSTRGYCADDSDRKGGAIPYVALLAAINLCAVVLANYQAYKGRNIHTEYSESRYIAVVNGSLLQAWLTGVPLLVLVRENPSALFVVGALILFLTSMAILLLIFVPKIEYLYKNKNGSNQKQASQRKFSSGVVAKKYAVSGGSSENFVAANVTQRSSSLGSVDQKSGFDGLAATKTSAECFDDEYKPDADGNVGELHVNP